MKKAYIALEYSPIMAVMEVLIHVIGDREAVIEYLKQSEIEYKIIGNAIWIKNCCVDLDNYGGYGNRLCFYSDIARENEGKLILRNMGWGDEYLSFKYQLKMFNNLKRAIMMHRAEYYKSTESKMQQKREEREEKLRELSEVINFE